jgi:hypothetical protein
MPCGKWPDLFILGVQKGATSSLCAAINAGGGVLGTGSCCNAHWDHCSNSEASMGETHFLSRCGSKNRCRSYSQLFPSTPVDAVATDCTPNHMTDPGAPALLKQIMPAPQQSRVRFIMSVRDPADRMLSWYNHRLATGAQFCAGRSRPTFHDDAHCELRKWATDTSLQRWWEGSNHYAPLSLMKGMYVQALRQWRHSWPRSRMLVINFHHLVSNQSVYMGIIREFSGVQHLSGHLPHTNAHASPNKVEKMCCQTAADLGRFVRAYAAACTELRAKLRSPHECCLRIAH